MMVLRLIVLFSLWSLAGYYYSGPMLALCLAREDAVSGWRDMLGPTEIKQAKEEHPQWYIKAHTLSSIHTTYCRS